MRVLVLWFFVIPAFLTSSELLADDLAVSNWQLTLDSTVWQEGYQGKDAQQAVVEYVPVGESVESWSSMVTSWVAFQAVAPMALYEQIGKGLAVGCPSLEIGIISKTETSLTFEWKHGGCQGFLPQHELKKLDLQGGWIYSLAVAKKGEGFSAEERATWISRLARADPRIDSPEPKRTYMGYEILDFPVEIADGEVVSLPITEGGPIPAETNDFKVEFAGFGVKPSSEDPRSASLVLRFLLRSKSAQEVLRILVEEVAPADPAEVLLLDEDPTFEDSLWLSELPVPGEVESSAPWLFEDEVSMFIFRITIQSFEGEETTLLQPTWFSSESKAALRQLIEKIET